MKKHIKVISIVVILFFVLTACKSSVMNYVNQETTARDMSDTSQNSKEATNNIKSRNGTELEKSAETKKTEETKGILPLTDEDFLLSDGKNVLELGLVFKNFSSPEPGKGSDYVGQSDNGDQAYDVYVHYYKDFDIFISDMGKGEVPPYTAPIIIEQIYLNTKKYKTNRGISIGLSKKDVLNVYGEGVIDKMEDDDTRTFLEYSLGNKSLSFELNNQDLIQRILLSLNS